MKPRIASGAHAWWPVALLILMAMCGCGGGADSDGSPGGLVADDDASDDDTDDDSSDDDATDDDGDDDTWPPLPDDDADDDASDDDATDDDTADDDSDDDTSDDDTADDDTSDDLPMPPDDGRLYVAAGRAIISPTLENHPSPWYVGGSSIRIATGVHDDLTASVLVFAKGNEHAVLVSVDLVGFPSPRTQVVKDALAVRGLEPDHIFISATHTHEAPDTLGIWGPDWTTSGRDETYSQFLTNTITQLVIDTWDDLTPVSVQAGRATINEPGSNYPGLIRDSRRPYLPYPDVAAARFIADDDSTVATLVNWHNHPEVTMSAMEFSADFPQWTRQRMETLFGGTSVYLSGAVGGLGTPLDVEVPAYDEAGTRLDDGGGNPVWLKGQSWQKSWSLGFALADWAELALGGEPVDASPALDVAAATIRIPVRNPLHIAAFLTGLVDRPANLDRDHFWECGIVGCIPEVIGRVRVGPLTIVTAPGETFPETLMGRDESSHDYGTDWGVFTFEAMTGYEEHLDDTIPMHAGLCNDELGYIVPFADMHELDHPDF
ncbi:MAG: hypothetical protein KJ042_07030, partial [Deltaproteobacteria bacterium]|nr:hypothetical protein [Deltaproteobacteria bacterium]